MSGGSILAAHLATHIRPWPEPGTSFGEWEKIEALFLGFVKKNIRTWPVVKRFLFPWNWPFPSTQVKALEACCRRHLTDLMLPDLLDRPNFVFCATDMTYGVSWVFERRRVGSYQAGYGKEFATSTIAPVRTDMDAFSDAESAVLMNHGYLLADIAIAVHVPQLIALPTEKQVPYPAWMDEERARIAALISGSGRRITFFLQRLCASSIIAHALADREHRDRNEAASSVETPPAPPGIPVPPSV